MPSPEPLQPYRRVQGQAEKDLARVLEFTAKRIQRRVERLPVGVGGEVRAAQLRLVLAEIRKLQRSMWRGALDPAIQAAVDASFEAAEDAVEAMTRVAYTALPEQVADALVDGLRATAESGLKSDAARRKRELSSRVWKQGSLHEGKVEDLIRQGLVSGLSAKELAKDVYEHVSPTTPGGASYAAMRLARTEINNALHERQLEGAKRPGVKAVQWNLSGSHKVPDECNVYAAHGGNGHWPVDGVPEKPHPQCFCFLTYVMMGAGEFADAFERGEFDDEIDRRTREKMARLAKQAEPEPTKKEESKPKLSVVKDEPAEGGRSVPKNDNLARSLKSGIVEEEVLSGGKQATTSKVTFGDGTAGVKKVMTSPIAKRSQDAEELVPMIARMMGIRAPEVIREDENTTVQQFLSGKIASGLLYEGLVTKYKARLAEKAKSDQGWLIGLLDQITFNMDRHAGNWLYDEDGNLIIIDHGLAWYNMRGKTDLSQPVAFRANDPFSMMFTTGKAGVGAAYKPKLDLHPGDLDAMVEILESLRPKFEELDQVEWLEFSLKQVEAIRPHAKGKKRRIPT